MDQLIIPSTFDAYMSGAQVKQAEIDRKRQKRFGELIGQLGTAQDREPLLQEAASIDPQGAMKAREFYSQQADRANAAKAEQDKRDAVLSLRKVQAMRSAPDSIKVQFYKQSAPDHYNQVVQMLGRDPTPQEINSFIDQNSAELYVRAGEQMPIKEPPQPRVVGRSLVGVNPDGTPKVLYTDPEPKSSRQDNAPSGYRTKSDGSLEFIPGGPADPSGPSARKNNAQLRKEFRSLPSVKNYEEVLPLMKTAEKAPDNGAGDLQIIYTVGKLLDPGSVVREGELNLVIASGSPLQRILGKTRFAFEKGGRLPPEQRRQLIGMLNERVNGYKQAYERDYKQYSKYATDSQLKPEDIVGKPASSAYEEPEQVQQGGVKFLGFE